MTPGFDPAELGRVRDAVREEYGSRLCAWIDGGTTRCCAINVPPHKCRCQEVARAALTALCERPAREDHAAVRDKALVEVIEALHTNGEPQAIDALLREFGCPICHADCAGANPPVTSCPTHYVRRALKGAPT